MSSHTDMLAVQSIGQSEWVPPCWLASGTNESLCQGMSFIYYAQCRRIKHKAQVVCSGSGSGKTIEYIVSQSSIIQAYHTCIKDVEKDYHVPEKTLHHGSPDIQSRIDMMRDDLCRLQPHKYKKGWIAPSMVVDYFQKGCGYFQWGMTWHSAVVGKPAEEEVYKVEAADLHV